MGHPVKRSRYSGTRAYVFQALGILAALVLVAYVLDDMRSQQAAIRALVCEVQELQHAERRLERLELEADRAERRDIDLILATMKEIAKRAGLDVDDLPSRAEFRERRRQNREDPSVQPSPSPTTRPTSRPTTRPTPTKSPRPTPTASPTESPLICVADICIERPPIERLAHRDNCMEGEP